MCMRAASRVTVTLQEVTLRVQCVAVTVQFLPSCLEYGGTRHEGSICWCASKGVRL